MAWQMARSSGKMTTTGFWAFLGYPWATLLPFPPFFSSVTGSYWVHCYRHWFAPEDSACKHHHHRCQGSGTEKTVLGFSIWEKTKIRRRNFCRPARPFLIHMMTARPTLKFIFQRGLVALGCRCASFTRSVCCSDSWSISADLDLLQQVFSYMCSYIMMLHVLKYCNTCSCSWCFVPSLGLPFQMMDVSLPFRVWLSWFECLRRSSCIDLRLAENFCLACLA